MTERIEIDVFEIDVSSVKRLNDTNVLFKTGFRLSCVMFERIEIDLFDIDFDLYICI